MAVNGSLSHKQRLLILTLLSEKTIEEAAEKAKISERTAHRWLKQPRFKKALAAAQQQAVRAAIDRLHVGLAKALDKLLILVDDANSSVALKASIAVIEHATALRSNFIPTVEVMKTLEMILFEIRSTLATSPLAPETRQQLLRSIGTRIAAVVQKTNENGQNPEDGAHSHEHPSS